MRQTLLLDVPDIHAGYIKLFRRYANSASAVAVLGERLIEQFRDPIREIRRLDPMTVARLISCLDCFTLVKEAVVVDSGDDPLLREGRIVTMNDVVCRGFAGWYLQNRDVVFDTTFLRWDSANVMSSSEIEYDRVAEFAEIAAIAQQAIDEGKLTTSSWREVGVVAFRGDTILGTCHNTHLPDEHSVFMEGDPRDYIEAGTNPQLSTAIHAEAKLVAQLGRPKLEGASVFLTTFPCVPCAQLLCEAGVKRLFYMSGNAYLHVDQVLRAFGMEIIYVNPPLR